MRISVPLHRRDRAFAVTSFMILSLIVGGCGPVGPSIGPSAPATPTAAPTAAAGAAGTQARQPPAEASPAGATLVPGPAPVTVPVPTQTTAARPTQPAAAPTVAAPAVAAPAIAAGLEGLSFDAFLEQSWRRMALRDPELVTELGLSTALGVGNDKLTDISDAYIRETQALEKAVLALLRTYDRTTLTPEQRLSADIYEAYLNDLVRGHAFAYSDYPVHPVVTSAHKELIQFFTDIHPIRTRRDAEDYIARLGQVDTRIEQLIAGLKMRELAGVIPPKLIIRATLPELRSLAAAEGGPRGTPFFTAFEGKVNALPGLGDSDRQTLLRAAEDEIARSVLPAFRALTDAMASQEAIAPDEVGVWRFPGGTDYYAYALRHHSDTDLTPDQVHELGLTEVARIHSEMVAVFDKLGYGKDGDIAALIGRAATEAGVVSGPQIRTGYETLIRDAEASMTTAFDRRPAAAVVVLSDPVGGYYIGPATDGSRPGAFYARITGTEYRFGMATLAYHEAVPGHHFQIALAQELALPSFRRGPISTAYVEGWALYAEQLAAELGFYRDDPYSDVGRLQAEAFRAARLVVDTGIHARRWTFNQAVDYMVQNAGMPRQRAEGEVARYVVWPGQATAYKIGMIKILALRQRARERLGDRFDLKAFHNVILGNGAMPLGILEKVVDDYIQARSG